MTNLSRARVLQEVRPCSQDEAHAMEKSPDERDLRDLSRVTGGPRRRYRVTAALLVIATAFSFLQTLGLVTLHAPIPMQGVNGAIIQPRDTSTTNWCFRWAMQSAIVNGTLYMYGGELTTVQGQTQNNWTNDFITLDLTQTWDIGSPTLNGLQAPSNVPQVALGYMWNSFDSLFLYGGETSWQPAVIPPPFATWEYDINNQQWTEYNNPLTSPGLNAPDSNVPVQRAAEGAGVMISTLGRGYYFGGHQDAYTTPGWEVWIPRLYLQSLLEFTLPGYANPDVDSLQGGAAAGTGGVYRNITQGGVQNQGGFTSRADGVLVYVPGFGDQGILVALGGGTNESFTEMNVINVYDIATSSWYNQATSGAYPSVRVNPCAVVAAAPDGSSINIYMWAGQNLLPYDQQVQYDDMWILTLPSFQWIQVDQTGQSVPPGRSGATCEIWNGQMIVIGGYVGPTYSCEYPGTFVFDLSSCQWATQYTVPSSASTDNFLNQQPAQLYKNIDNAGGLPGSYGYTVPDIVISKIGGNAQGGATLTKPIQAPTGGPLATGNPAIYSTTTYKTTYTTTLPNGHTATETGQAVGYTPPQHSSNNNGTEIAAIVVGVVCGLALILIIYLLFCLFLYRKQLALYKRHVEMSHAQGYQRGEKDGSGNAHDGSAILPGLWASNESGQESDRSNRQRQRQQLLGQGQSQGQNGDNDITAVVSTRRGSEHSDSGDLLMRNEPSFFGVMLHPRRSLKVVNRD